MNDEAVFEVHPVTLMMVVGEFSGGLKNIKSNLGLLTVLRTFDIKVFNQEHEGTH